MFHVPCKNMNKREGITVLDAQGNISCRQGNENSAKRSQSSVFERQTLLLLLSDRVFFYIPCLLEGLPPSPKLCLYPRSSKYRDHVR